VLANASVILHNEAGAQHTGVSAGDGNEIVVGVQQGRERGLHLARHGIAVANAPEVVASEDLRR
jgi:hypothetical protein